MHRYASHERSLPMLAFLDFEASSLAKHSYPIEVAWVFEDGTSEAHLIRPADGWDDWDMRAQAIHKIGRETLLSDGEPHDAVARRMVEVLTGHDLTATAPSWDGKWLSTLLRSAGLPRHSLRLRDTRDAQRDTVRAILEGGFASDQLGAQVERVIAGLRDATPDAPVAHRALADAQVEYERWQAARSAAEHFRADLQPIA